MNNYQPNYFNQGFNMYGTNPMQSPMQGPTQRVQPMEQSYNQYSQPQPIYRQQIGLQGKSVDSIDVVKATDINLDGSINYFPLTDGSAIVTKQIMMDGTSKVVVYKPVDETNIDATPKYITEERVEEIVNNNNNFSEFKKNLKEINRQIEDMSSDISEIRKNIKDRKDK